MHRHFRIFILAVIACFFLMAAGWGALALWYQIPGTSTKWVLAGLWVAVILMSLLVMALRSLRAGLIIGVTSLLLLLSWWSGISPSNDRTWAPDVSQQVTSARSPSDPSLITLKNVRNFDWETPENATEIWETRSYDLKQVESLDLILSHWSGPLIAHTLVSFGFSDGEHLVFSVEIRRESDEAFSTYAGFFRKYELSIVAADERDIVRLRTNVRKEDVYLYRVSMPREAITALFLEYLDTANQLAANPRFYNTITANCTTIIYDLARQIVPGLPLDSSLLLSGLLPSYLYDLRALDMSRSLSELTAVSGITGAGQTAGDDPSYSRLIRAGIPPVTTQ